MAGKNNLLRKSSEFVSKLFTNKLPDWAFYHSYAHTAATVDACGQIGRGVELNESDIELVSLAAWFHDTGFIETCEGHEERSITIASRFLEEYGYPQENLDRVAGCIMATKMPQNPTTLLQRVICDADMVFLGREEFFNTNNLLKREIEKRENKAIPEVAWLERSIAFVSKQQFHTQYATRRLNPQREKNLLTLREQLQEAIAEEKRLKIAGSSQRNRS